VRGPVDGWAQDERLPASVRRMRIDEALAQWGDRAVASHHSAAALLGLPVYGVRRPALTIPRSQGRPRHGASSGAVERHWADLRDGQLEERRSLLVTAPLRTVTDCGRMLPLREAVAVAGAALRLGLVTAIELAETAEGLRGPGATTAITALGLADARAGSGNESLARVSLLLAGLGPVLPQARLEDDPYAHPVDLLLAWARTAVEVESAEHHADWLAVRRDIGHHDVANRLAVTLVRTFPAELWPGDALFLRKVVDAVCAAPGRRCRDIRRRRDLRQGPD